MGYSLGGHIAQAFTVSYPDKVNRLILVATMCGGKDSIPKPPEFKIRVRKTTTAALIHIIQIFVNLNRYVIKYKTINSY